MGKDVKIIGLHVNQRMGVLQAFDVEFDKDSNLIAVKGAVGSGKTTMQRALRLGTQGSDTLKEDKGLYGKIDQEVQLLDGGTNIYVGCKTSKGGAIEYVIYAKGEDGKIIKDPVVDGVKLTPANYLKNLQTALTWRMDELCSENQTTQRKILLELYAPDLAKLGVVFDKTSDAYADSILGRIDLAVNSRSEKDFERKRVVGFQNHLEPLGIDVDQPDTLPVRQDISELESKKNKLQYDIDNVGAGKESDLQALKNKADAVVLRLRTWNANAVTRNGIKEMQFESDVKRQAENMEAYHDVRARIDDMSKKDCLSNDNYHLLLKTLEQSFNNPMPVCEKLESLIEFDDKGRCMSKKEQWDATSDAYALLNELEGYKLEYKKRHERPDGDTTALEADLKIVVANVALAKENNVKCDMVDAFLGWSKAHSEVMALRDEYAGMLESINTGVDGLLICVDKSDEGKLDIYLTYNGYYDPKYFGNIKLENRKLSSYSDTQKPLVCLLLQSYLLGKKEKAMRYLWIDKVPIDNATKALLNKMGTDLGVTIFVNITGDFDKDGLESGEILIDGGEIFFK